MFFKAPLKTPLSNFLIPFNFAFGDNLSTGNLIRTERAEACREICKLGNGFFINQDSSPSSTDRLIKNL